MDAIEKGIGKMKDAGSNVKSKVLGKECSEFEEQKLMKPEKSSNAENSNNVMIGKSDLDSIMSTLRDLELEQNKMRGRERIVEQKIEYLQHELNKISLAVFSGTTSQSLYPSFGNHGHNCKLLSPISRSPGRGDDEDGRDNDQQRDRSGSNSQSRESRHDKGNNRGDNNRGDDNRGNNEARKASQGQKDHKQNERRESTGGELMFGNRGGNRN